jgi:hypothetical protein
MASFTEDRIQVNLIVTRDPTDGTDHVYLNVASFDTAKNVQVRTARNVDVTALMSSARMTGIKALIDDAIAYVKQDWAIPTLVAAKAVEAPTENQGNLH